MQHTCQNRQNTANCKICANDNKNKNLIKTNNKNNCTTAEIDCTKDKKGAKVKGSSMKNISTNNSVICTAESRARQFCGLTLINIIISILAVSFIALTTFGALKDSKTATGTIAFTFDSPALCFDNGVEMFYSNVGLDGTLNNGEISYGNSNGISLVTDSKYKVAIDDQNQLSQYYVKIEYIFSDLSSTESLISFDSATYKFGETSLGAVTADSVLKNRFSLTSTATVKTGVTFNLFEPLSHFTYIGEQLTTSTTPQTIYIVISADTKKDMSDSRAQATISGQIGFNVVVGSTVTGVSDLNNVIIENLYQNGTYKSSTVSSSVSVTVSNPAKYTKITMQSATPLFVAGTQTSTMDNWDYKLTTDASKTVLTAVNAGTLGKIDVTSVLQKAPVGTFSTAQTNVAYTFSIASSVDGVNYASMNDANTGAIASATLKVDIINQTKPTYTTSGKMEIYTHSGDYESISVTSSLTISDISPTIYLKMVVDVPLSSTQSDSKDVTYESINYTCTKEESNTNLFKFTVISKEKVSSVDLSKLLVECMKVDNFLWSSSTINSELLLSYSLDGTNFYILDDTMSCTFTTSLSMCCITGDTEVSVGFNGESKFANAIAIGDKVLTMNTATGELSLESIIKVIVVTRYAMATVRLKDGSVLNLTPDHPILTSTGWAICGKSTQYDISPDVMRDTPLAVGDMVKTLSGYVEVESIDIMTTTRGITVYSYSVENNHNLFAGGMLIHNVPCPTKPVV